jgi:septum formation protein
VNETRKENEAPAAYVLRLAESKARAAAPHVINESIIIGADTAVVDGEDVLGKPADAAEARTMLRRLRGHTHQVYTGIAAFRPRDGKLLTDLCITEVPMRDYSDAEIEAYTRTADPLDKAGAYAIQHASFNPVERLAGCYASVMGLSLCHLVRTLRKFEIEPPVDVPAGCQSHLKYDCPVSAAILRGEQVG